MDRIRIVGGCPLNGSIPISGAKNATLPLMEPLMVCADAAIDNSSRHVKAETKHLSCRIETSLKEPTRLRSCEKTLDPRSI